MNDLKLVQKEYARWLSEYEWQWFCTLTFREPDKRYGASSAKLAGRVHPEIAYKKFGAWINGIDGDIFGKWYTKKGMNLGIRWVLAEEYTKQGRIHFHALLGDSKNFVRRNQDQSGFDEVFELECFRASAKDAWFRLGGFADMKRINQNIKAVTNYVSKYVIKGGDILVSETLSASQDPLTHSGDDEG